MVIKTDEDIKPEKEKQKRQEEENAFKKFKEDFKNLSKIKYINKRHSSLLESTINKYSSNKNKWLQDSSNKDKWISDDVFFYEVLKFLIRPNIYSIKKQFIKNFVINNSDKMTLAISRLLFKDFVFDEKKAEEYKKLKKEADIKRKKKEDELRSKQEETKKKEEENSIKFSKSLLKNLTIWRVEEEIKKKKREEENKDKDKGKGKRL
jgi:hypothetical protein